MKKNYILTTHLTTITQLWYSFTQKSKTKALSLLVVLLSFFGVSDAFGQSPRDFTTSGTFTVPQGVTTLTIDCIGAGGSGGSARGNNDQGAGGGAGGQYARSTISVNAGEIYVVTVAGVTLAPSGTNNTTSKNIIKTQSPLLVEVTLANGSTKTYKVIF